MSDRTEAEEIDPDVHIDPDDPRYDGFRIREYWIATMTGDDNQEGIIFVNDLSSSLFHLQPGLAMAADERRLRHLREFAKATSVRYAMEVRIRHFVPDGEDEVIRAK